MDPWVGKIPWRREWPPTPVFVPGEFHGQRSLAGYSHCFPGSVELGYIWNFNWFLIYQADDTYLSELFTVESLFDAGRYTGKDVIGTCSQKRCGQILCVSACVYVCERERSHRGCRRLWPGTPEAAAVTVGQEGWPFTLNLTPLTSSSSAWMGGNTDTVTPFVSSVWDHHGQASPGVKPRGEGETE